MVSVPARRLLQTGHRARPGYAVIRSVRGMKAVPVAWALAAAVLTATLLAGCASNAPSGPLQPVGQPTQPAGSATTRPPAPPTNPVPGVNRADLMTVYRAWWQAVQEAFASGDSTSAKMALFGADPILTRERNEIRGLRAQGVVQRTSLVLSPHILHQDDITAEVADCVRGPAGTYYDLATGTPRAPHGYRNDVPTKDPLLVSLHKVGGYWYVVVATNKGVQPC